MVGEPVGRALAVLEALVPARNEMLFGRLPHGPGYQHRHLTRVLTTSMTNRHLCEFIDWINTYCQEHGRNDIIPDVNGQPWQLKTSEFRRTLAWFIARRPGGNIAGAIAYRHHSIQMFEGYAGTSESGFRAEVESEQALARGETLIAAIENHEHDQLAGPAAGEAARRLAEFGDRARFQGMVVLDTKRLRRLMDRHDPAIYPGKYITCVHTHSRALCEKAKRGGSEGLPRPRWMPATGLPQRGTRQRQHRRLAPGGRQHQQAAGYPSATSAPSRAPAASKTG